MNNYTLFMRVGVIILTLLALSTAIAVQDDKVNLTNSPCIISGPASSPYNRCTIFLKPGDYFNVTFNVTGIISPILNTGNNQLDSLTVFLDNIDDVHPASYYGFDIKGVTNWASQYFGEGDWKISKDLDYYDYVVLGENFTVTFQADPNVANIDVNPEGGMTNLTGYMNYNDDDTNDANNFVAFKPINDPGNELVYLVLYVDASKPLITDVHYWNEENQTIAGLEYVGNLTDDGIKFRANVTDLPSSFGLANVTFIWNQTNPFTNQTMIAGASPWYYFNLTASDGLIENTTVYYKVFAVDKAGNTNESIVYAVFPRDYPRVIDYTGSNYNPGVSVNVNAFINDFSLVYGLNATLDWNTTGPNTNSSNQDQTSYQNKTTTSYSQLTGPFDEGDVVNYTITVTDVWGWQTIVKDSFTINQDNPLVTNITHSSTLPETGINITANITDLSAFNASITCNVTVNTPCNTTSYTVYGDMFIKSGNLYTFNIGSFNENDTISCFINATDKYGYTGNNTHSFQVQQDYPAITSITNNTNYPDQQVNITALITDLSSFTSYIGCNVTVNHPLNTTSYIIYGTMHHLTGNYYTYNIGSFNENDTIKCVINATDKFCYYSQALHNVYIKQDYPRVYNLSASTNRPGETVVIRANITDISDSQSPFIVKLNYWVNNLTQTIVNMVWESGDIWRADIGPFNSKDYINYTINATDKYGYVGANSSAVEMLGLFNVTFFVRDKIGNYSLSDVNVTYNSSTTDFDYNITFTNLLEGERTFLFKKMGYLDNSSTFNITGNANYTIYMTDVQPPEILVQRLIISSNSTAYNVTVQAVIQENGHLNFSYFNYSWFSETLVNTSYYNCTNTVADNWTCTFFLGYYNDEYRLLYFHTYAEDDYGLYDNESAGAHHIYFYPAEAVFLKEDTNEPNKNVTITATLSGVTWTSALLNYTINGTDNYSVNMTNSSATSWDGVTIKLGENWTVNYTVIASNGRSYSANFTTLYDYPQINDLNKSSRNPYELITISANITDYSVFASTINYSINGAPQTPLTLTQAGNLWKATIGPLNPGDNVTYCIWAKDIYGFENTTCTSFLIKSVYNTTFEVRDLLTNNYLNNVNMSYDSYSYLINGSRSFNVIEGLHVFKFTRPSYADNVTSINVTSNNTYVIYMSDNKPPVITKQTINVSNQGSYYSTEVVIYIEDESDLINATIFYSFDSDSLINSTILSCARSGNNYTCTAYLGNFTGGSKDIYYKVYAEDAYNNWVLGNIIRSRIDFGQVTCPACPACPSCPGCPSCPTCPACEPNITVVTVTEYKTKSLLIEAPWVLQAVPPSSTISINLKNIGDVELTNLRLVLTPRYTTTVDYESVIGSLAPGQERTITATVSNLTRAYDFVLINATDNIDYWTSAFIVYVPETPLAGPSDCIEFTPRIISVNDCVNLSALHCNAYDETCGSTMITITARNKCEASLSNVELIISELGYRSFINSLNKEHVITINAGRNPPREVNVNAFYTGGSSSETIRINLVSPLFSIIFNSEFLIAIIIILTFLSLIILTTAYYNVKKKVKIERLRTQEAINKLKELSDEAEKAKKIVKAVTKSDEDYNKLLKEIDKLK